MSFLKVPESDNLAPGRSCYQIATFYKLPNTNPLHITMMVEQQIVNWRNASIRTVLFLGYRKFDRVTDSYSCPLRVTNVKITDADINGPNTFIPAFNQMMNDLSIHNNQLFSIPLFRGDVERPQMKLSPDNKKRPVTLEKKELKKTFFPLTGTDRCHVFYVDERKNPNVDDVWRQCRMLMRAEIAEYCNMSTSVRFEGLDAALLMAIIRALAKTDWNRNGDQQTILLNHLTDLLGKPEAGIVGKTMLEVLKTQFTKKFTWIEKMFAREGDEYISNLFSRVKNFIDNLTVEDADPPHKLVVTNSPSEIQTMAMNADVPSLRPVPKEDFNANDPIRLYLNRDVPQNLHRLLEETKPPSEAVNMRDSWETLKGGDGDGGRYTLDNFNPRTELRDKLMPLLQYIQGIIKSIGADAEGLHVVCYGGAVVSIMGGQTPRDIDLCFVYDPSGNVTDRSTMTCVESMPDKAKKDRLNKVIKRILSIVFTDVEEGKWRHLQIVRKKKEEEKKKEEGKNGPPPCKIPKRDDSYPDSDDDDDFESRKKTTTEDDAGNEGAAARDPRFQDIADQLMELGDLQDNPDEFQRLYKQVTDELSVIKCEVQLKTSVVYQGTEVEFQAKLKKAWSGNTCRGLPYDIFAYLDKNGDIAVMASDYTRFCLQNGRFWLPDPRNVVGVDRAGLVDFVRSLMSPQRVGSYILNKGFIAHVPAAVLHKGVYINSIGCLVPKLTSNPLVPHIRTCIAYLNGKYREVVEKNN